MKVWEASRGGVAEQPRDHTEQPCGSIRLAVATVTGRSQRRQSFPPAENRGKGDLLEKYSYG